MSEKGRDIFRQEHQQNAGFAAKISSLPSIWAGVLIRWQGARLIYRAGHILDRNVIMAGAELAVDLQRPVRLDHVSQGLVGHA